MLNSTKEAYDLLELLGAKKQLIVHVQLVSEAAENLIEIIDKIGVDFDKEFVRIGAVIHDVGKTIHPNELSGEGHEHELSGEHLLLKNGVQPEVARCCVSHAQFDTMDVSFEELIVALSDKLWKGKRVESLELQLIDQAAKMLGKERWNIFSDLDACFEEISADGDKRLMKSMYG